MSKKSNKQKTAAEVWAELQADPAFRQREIEADQKRLLREQAISRLLEPLLMKLHELGLQGTSLREIVRKFAPLPNDAIEIMLAELVNMSDMSAALSVNPLASSDESEHAAP